MLETGSNYDKKYLTKYFFISTFFFRFTVYQTTKTIKVMASSIKLSPGTKVTVTGPLLTGSYISQGSTVYAIRYISSCEAWQVSRSKGGPEIATVRRKYLKPVTESETGLKVGDRVQVKSGTTVSSALYGTYGTIKKKDGTGIPFFVKLEDASIVGAWFRENELAKVAAKPVATKFKVGDSVQIKKSTSAVSAVWGKCGKVERISLVVPCAAPYYVKLEGTTAGWFKESELTNPIAPKKTDELTVDAAFLKAAHAAACAEWKKKLEKKYPSVFKKPKTWKPKDLKTKVTFDGDGSKNIFIGMGLAPDGLTGRCLMMRKDTVVPEITSDGVYFVVTFKTLQD